MRLPTLAVALFLFCILCWEGGTALARSFTPGPYQNGDGAVTVGADGDFVDPYFANRALTLADEFGLDVRAAANPWIRWAMARQLEDGRFERYCRSDTTRWSSCEPADADDAVLAVWLELLYRIAPESGLPASWSSSATRALSYLETLRDKGSGLYVISHDLSVSLLMDNVEIYHSFRTIGAANRRFGKQELGHRYEQKAALLAGAIVRNLWISQSSSFRVSTQERQPGTFYPDAVAQMYAWTFGMPTPSRSASNAFQHWLDLHESTWLNRTEDAFPWGIVALTAYRFGRTDYVRLWLESVSPLRHGPYWTVLEEAILQALQ